MITLLTRIVDANKHIFVLLSQIVQEFLQTRGVQLNDIFDELIARVDC